MGHRPEQQPDGGKNEVKERLEDVERRVALIQAEVRELQE